METESPWAAAPSVEPIRPWDESTSEQLSGPQANPQSQQLSGPQANPQFELLSGQQINPQPEQLSEPHGNPQSLQLSGPHSNPQFERVSEPYATQSDRLSEPRAGRPSKPRGRLGAALAAVIAFLAKFKAVLLLLPKLKLLTTVGTMLVSVAAYSFVFGWQFAFGFVALLFVHEMGHVIQLRREGLRASAPMFIPFLGAVISARSLGDNALAEARVGLAGPILGSIGSAACIAIWHATGNDLWRALAFTGFFLNLFNLLPVVPLDGGRAMAAMAPWMWFVGFAAVIPLALIFPNPVIFLILIFAGYETYKRWKLRRNGGIRQQAYYRVRPLDRALVAAVYLSLIALLVVGMHATTLTRTFA